MSEQVTSFIPVEAGEQRYLFFFVTWNDFVTPITEELRKHREAFGEALGLQGSVIQAYRSATRETFREVVQKGWPPKITERMNSEQDPFMVVIGDDFKRFDPSVHRWSLVWFSDFWEKTDSIWRVFAALAQKVQRGENIFEYLEGVSRFAHIFLSFLKFSSHLNGNKWSFLGISPHSRIYCTLTWFQVGQPNHFSIDFYPGSGRTPDRISKTR